MSDRLQGAQRFGHPYPLIVATAGAMLLLGLLMILSASHVESLEIYGSPFTFFNRQAIGALIGVGSAVLLARSDYRSLRKFAGPLMVAVMVLLFLVLLPGVGLVRGGSSRWIPIGGLNLQPSEAAKLVLVLFAAHVFEKKRKLIDDFRELAIPVFVLGGLVVLLVILQPDLGTAIICAGCVLVVTYLAGARLRHLWGVFGIGALAAAALVLAEGYRRTRVFTFLNPWEDPTGSGWQPIQGQIALGSGGLFGVGLGASRQKWSYVPNAHTDFIFAIIGEELGLIGALTVLVLFVFFVYLGVRTARRAPDHFGFLLAGGITAWLGLQAVINMGAVSGVLPITGVPLPFISFGGSSLVFTLAGLGILLSIARRGRHQTSKR